MADGGFVYLVGAGPGDPGLLTVRATELIRTAEVVAHDALVSREILSLVPADAELLPVGRRHGRGKTLYRLHPAVLERAQAGRMVVRLKAGDPLIFGRGGEEAADLALAGIPFEIVPGISAALGAAAYAGIPLTHREYASEVTFATGHDAEATGGSHGRTRVFFMAAHRLTAILESLMREGVSPEACAAYIASATTRGQRVVTGTLGGLAGRVTDLDPSAPALVIVGEVVRLREQIAWFEQRPLAGRRILVARARPGRSAIAARLRMLGAQVLEAPTVEAGELDEYSDLDEALSNLDRFSGLLFGCAAGVVATARRLGQRGTDLRAANPRLLVAIGVEADRAMRRFGLAPIVTIEGACHDALAARVWRRERTPFLLITGDQGRPNLMAELRELGVEVRATAAYRYVYRIPPLSAASLDLVILPSSSAVRHLLASGAGSALLGLPMLAIGRRTEEAARELKAAHVARAKTDNIESMIKSTVEALAGESTRGVPGSAISA